MRPICPVNPRGIERLPLARNPGEDSFERLLNPPAELFAHRLLFATSVVGVEPQRTTVP
jgi:hypothetical protein